MRPGIGCLGSYRYTKKKAEKENTKGRKEQIGIRKKYTNKKQKGQNGEIALEDYLL